MNGARVGAHGALVCALVFVVACDDGASSAPAPVVDAAVDAAMLPDVAVIGRCEPTAEVCNGVDDDCDELVDADDPDLRATLATDPDHCGACDQPCAPANALPACVEGRCGIAACDPGFDDRNADPSDGCEATCIISAGGREICDAVDNDCDGMVDEGFDLQTDAAHCGACDRACPQPANAAAVCIAGECALGACAGGFVDLDGDAANGCEYACTPTATARTREFCNALDDDCDGQVDEIADLQLPEALCPQAGVCGARCGADDDCAGGEQCAAGVCVPADGAGAGADCATDDDCRALHPGYACLAFPTVDLAGGVTTRRACMPRPLGPTCDGGAGFRCPAPTDFVRGSEQGRCDGLDNDCDGRTDEDFAEALFEGGLGGPPRTCAEGVGLCRVEAEARCSDDGAQVVCEAAATPPAGADDDCDGVDDDCDGRVDEAFVDAWVRLDGVEIYAYEASRPGATPDAPGLDPVPDDDVVAFVETRACARPGVLPWANVTLAGARAACSAAGARLCTGAEWALACGGAEGRAYPYGPAYDAQACNGGARDADPATPGVQDAALPTGALATCAAAGAFDLSGNLKEWTDDPRDDLVVVRGGGYETNVAAGLACDQQGDLKPPTFASATTGFRCCRDLP